MAGVKSNDSAYTAINSVTEILQEDYLKYYSTFKVRIHLHWIAGRANILSKYIIYIFQF